MQLTFIIEAEHVAATRSLARLFFGVPADYIFIREIDGFGDFMEYPMIPVGADPEATSPTHYFCSDTYRDEGPRGGEALKQFVADQNEPWLQVLEGDPRIVLANLGLQLQKRLPEYPEQIKGIDF